MNMMNKLFSALFSVALIALIVTRCKSPDDQLVIASYCDSTEWELVWRDEFDYTGLPEPSKWEYEVGYVRNNERQYYTEARLENARVEDDMLIIEARKETYKGYDYTSASLHTKNTVNWLYGRIEVKAKIPTGKGMWPAIWMLGNNIDEVGWPKSGEIDIMENVGYDPDTIVMGVHTEAYNPDSGTSKGFATPISAPYQEFHVYAIEWFTDKIDFYVDGTKMYTFENEGTGQDTWPFDHPYYLILNAAVGGNWGGIKGIDDTIFPQRYFIDYVRVYGCK